LSGGNESDIKNAPPLLCTLLLNGTIVNADRGYDSQSTKVTAQYRKHRGKRGGGFHRCPLYAALILSIKLWLITPFTRNYDQNRQNLLF
jgi:hypothetical protein